MPDSARVIDDMTEMVANMSPILQPETFVFCSTFSNEDNSEAIKVAKAMIHEDEGMSLILERSDAVSLGYIFDSTLRQITLMVYSSLEGVGLTSAVSSALAQRGIACNMVAGMHHDHLFVPARRANDAVKALLELQEEAQRHMV